MNFQRHSSARLNGRIAALFALFGLLLPPAPAHSAAPPKSQADMKPVVRKAPPPMTVAEAEALVQKSPKDTNASLALGGAYRRSRRYPQALEAFQKMAALDPQNSTARYSLGAVYMDMNRPKDAEREILAKGLD